MRRRNLARLLQLVHVHGPMSRARLTQTTGLNRSTVAALVAELCALGLVLELAPEETNRAGRPSPVVAPHPAACALAVNPEVDAVTVAVVSLDGAIVARQRVEVDHLVTPEQTGAIVAELRHRWLAGPLADRRLLGVGVAVPGLVRAGDGLVRDAPHLEWRDAAVRDLMQAETGLPTAVGNDASLGALAEHLFGAGRGIDDLVYLNGGASGIGGGVLIGGQLVGGAGGYAGEFGQNRPGIADAADRRAVDGVLEDEVSRTWLLQVVGLSVADEPTLAAAIHASSDPAVAAEVRRQRGILATALGNAVNVLNPSLIVLGGFLATLAGEDPGRLLAAVAQQAMPAACEQLALRVAALGEDRLLIGAAEAAFTAVLADPTVAG